MADGKRRKMQSPWPAYTFVAFLLGTSTAIVTGSTLSLWIALIIPASRLLYLIASDW